MSTRRPSPFRSRSGGTATPRRSPRPTWQLRRELLDLEVDAVEAPGAGEPPPGSRAVDVAALGALVVNLADSACDGVLLPNVTPAAK